MGISIEEQRELIRQKRNPKRFYNVNHLKINRNKIKGNPRKIEEKIKNVYNEVERLLEGDYYKSKKQIKKQRKKELQPLREKHGKKLTPRQLKYRDYLLSDEWAQLKIDLYQFRGRRCEICSKTSSLHVHHKTYKNIFEENPEDLQILCSSCHKNHHNIK